MTYYPTGFIIEASAWSRQDEAPFSKLGVRPAKKNDTYLAAFLSCWLCTFIFPSEDGYFIRPSTFKMASMMAAGRKTSLAIPVLASIYNNLNKISRFSRLDLIKVRFPIHYVYSWLTYYFKTHHALAKIQYAPLMVRYSGEGAARNFNNKDARNCIHRGEGIVWSSTMMKSPQPHSYVDDNNVEELDSSYFMSIRFNYLSLRNGNSFILEPYSPHRFSRQFGFCQNIPGILMKDIRSVSLEEGLRYFRICVSHKTKSQATFPPAIPNMKKLLSATYKTWWERTHGKFRNDHLQSLVKAAGQTTNPPSGNRRQQCSKDAPRVHQLPIPKAKLPAQDEGKVFQRQEGNEGVSHASNKRPSPDESGSSDKDCYWKRAKVHPSQVGGTNANVVDVSDSASSSSKTLTAPIKKSNDIGVLGASQQGKVQASGESIVAPNSRNLPSGSKGDQEVASTLHDGSNNKPSPNSNKPAASVFVGAKLVQAVQKKYVLYLWDGFQEKLPGIDLNSVSSHEEDIQVVLAAMEGKGVDISYLRNLLQSFLELAISYDKDRSALSDNALESTRLELFAKAGERLSLAMLEEEEKAEKVSSVRKSIDKVREKMEKLREEERNLEVLEATEKEIEGAKSRVSAAKEEYNACTDSASLIANATANLEKKKERLEACRQDLLNYKLSLE